MTTKLRLYQNACLVLGTTPVVSLAENNPVRYALDTVYDNDMVRVCLEQGQWNFGTRTVKMSYDTDVAPPFGLNKAFAKPDDYVRTTALCQDEWFRIPILEYADENNYIFASLETVYLKYVSNDDKFGGDLSIWAPSFSTFVEVFMAWKLAPLHARDKDRRREINELYRMAKIDARSKDVMNQPTEFPAQGSWLRYRQGRSGGSRDFGNPTQLLG